MVWGFTGFQLGGVAGGLLKFLTGDTNVGRALFLISSFSGAVIGHKIQRYMQIKRSSGIEKCYGSIQCELKVLDKAIREAKTSGIKACNESKDPAKCRELVNWNIQKFEELKAKKQSKLKDIKR